MYFNKKIQGFEAAKGRKTITYWWNPRNREDRKEIHLMIIISLNARGEKDALKQKSIKILFTIYKPEVVMLQETMCSN